jgi:phosphoserine phosphatase
MFGAMRSGMRRRERSHVSHDPLPSWRVGAAKTAIIDFVDAITDTDGPGYLPPSERLATFDSDGTLVVEQPRPLEEFFAWHKMGFRVPTQARKLPFPIPKSLQGLGHLVGSLPFAGDTPEEYEAEARRFLDSFCHPRYGCDIGKLVYQPMLELLRLLEANEFTTAVVSASGMSFVRAFVGRAYGLRLDQVVGTTVAYYVRERGGRIRAERGRFLIGGVTTRGRKPSHVQQRFGRLPIFHAGNSSGDVEMFEIAGSSGRAGLALVICHDDAEREDVYTGDGADPTDVCKNAAQRGWTIASMRDDWERVFAE